MNKLTLPIEVGKSYVRRDGRIVVAREVPEEYTTESVLINVAGEPSGSGQMAWKGTGRVSHLNNQDPLDLIADHIPTKGHVHASLMAEYAADAAECEEPWTRWQTNDATGAVWFDLDSQPVWVVNRGYRRRPKTIKLGDKEIPAPLRAAPVMGADWFALSLRGVIRYEWSGSYFCAEHIDKGIAFATKEDAEAARLAILEMLKP